MSEYLFENKLNSFSIVKNNQTTDLVLTTDLEELTSDVTSGNSIKLNVPYKIDFGKGVGQMNFSSNWYEGETGVSGCTSSHCGCTSSYSYSDDSIGTELEGYNVSSIAIQSTNESLNLVYEVNSTRSKHVLYNTNLEPTTYNSSNPVSFKFNADLTINFCQIYFTFKCKNNACLENEATSSGYAYCYFTSSSDS